ncbi:AAA family ATPase [Halobacterium wangiae]|uniref:AAA family ATPase n=1 Tax=Halobacterium wangiae TaxID=2902623 RepID=UPI001E38B7CA|nr:AAA family ATPase [Halobacterium wangiae]
MSGEHATGDTATTRRGPYLVVVCGLPGAGKTTVSEHAADALDGRLLRTDVVRKELFPDPDYTPEERAAVYEELFDRATETLRQRRSVVLDGTFTYREHRGDARRTAQAVGVPLSLVKVACDEDVVRERIRARTGDASDADFEIHKQYREEFEPIAGPFARVDNSGRLDETLEQVDALL